MKCPVCKSDKISGFLSIDSLPLILFPVIEEMKDNILNKAINSYICDDCTHIFRNPLDENELEIIYKKYYSFYPFDNLESMNAPYRKPFENLFSRVLKEVKVKGFNTLLEIGCSSGKQLEAYNKYNFDCFGIDPSPLNEMSSSNFISGKYEEYKFENKFDIIVSRFNLEHVNNINYFLQKIHNDLSDDGLVFIQVPNIKTYIENLVPLFLAHEHIHYFNPYSLFLATNNNEFEIIDVEYNDKQSIIFGLKKKSCHTYKVKEINILKTNKSFYNDYLIKRNNLKNDIIEKIDFKIQTCFYGAGLPLCWLLYDLNFKSKLDDFKIIDDNSILNGRVFPETNNQIINFNSLKKNSKLNVILTLNPFYHEGVIKKLKNISEDINILAINKNGLIKI